MLENSKWNMPFCEAMEKLMIPFKVKEPIEEEQFQCFQMISSKVGFVQ